MSAALTMSPAVISPVDLPTTGAVAAPIGGSGRRTSAFPVGARFPRWTADQLTAPRSEPRVASDGPDFPLGARFRRRTESDVIAYLTAQLAAADTTIISTRRIYPVGARFPRR